MSNHQDDPDDDMIEYFRELEQLEQAVDRCCTPEHTEQQLYLVKTLAHLGSYMDAEGLTWPDER